MTVCVRLPANLRPLAENQSSLELDAETVGEALKQVISQYPALQQRLLNAEGEPQSFINVFVNEQSIRDIDNLDSAVQQGDEILIIAALAGG